MDQKLPGDVYIKTISLFTDSGIVNIAEIVKFTNIYESIMTPGFIVQLTIDDTRNILSAIKILGGERLILELASPNREDRTIELAVSSVNDVTVSNNMIVKSYTIEAVTPEALIDKSQLVCKSYNTNVSNIVQDVITAYLRSKKKLNIQPTRGVQKIIVPSMRPFDTIAMLRKRSISVDDKSSMYMFFENIDGLHFRTIENLMTGSVGDRVFINDTTQHTDITQSSFRNIISYSQPNQFDTANRLNSGGLINSVNKLDLKTLKYTTTTTKFNASNFKSADGKMKDPDNSSTVNKYASTSGTNLWVSHDSSLPDTFIADGLGLRASMASLLSQGSINLHVFGDSALSAGQLITVNILDNQSTSQTPQLHPQLSGNYVIAFLRHMIASEGDSPRYTCSIQALKGGYKSV